jgi:protein involved in polysaccharide export with SLBB domain
MVTRLICAILAIVSIGCSTTGSGGIILFPAPHKLLPETKRLRSSYPAPISWPRELAKRTTGPAIAEPGDVIALSLADPESRILLPGEQPVLIDGSIDLGTYGRVQVAYMTCEQIEAVVEATIKAKSTKNSKDSGDKEVDVNVRFARSPESKVVYVLGDVTTPGSYALEGRETVLDALLIAGGLTRKADEYGIILVRPTGPCDTRMVLPICYHEIVQWGDTSTNYQVMPGDRIYVPTRSLWSRLFGRPEKKRCPPCGGCPHPMPLPPELCCTPNAPASHVEYEPFAVPPAPGMTAPVPDKKPDQPKPMEEPKKDDRKSAQAKMPMQLPAEITDNPWRPIFPKSDAAGPAINSLR